MHETRYTVGQDHTGSWWVVSPGGHEGYEFGPDHDDAAQATQAAEWANERGAEIGLDAADPPPELVGGVGDTGLERRLAEDRFGGWPPGDLTARDWDYPAPRSMWEGYAGG